MPAPHVLKRIVCSQRAAVNSDANSPEADAYFARLSLAGLSADETHDNAIADLINGLVSDGVWPKLDALWITAAFSLDIARLNLVSSSYALVDTSGNAPTFVADRGIKCTVTGQSTQYTPSTAAGVLTLNSAHVMVWPNEAIDSNAGDFGTLAGTGGHIYVYTDTPAGTFGNALRLNANSGGDPYGHATSGKGFYLGSRDNSTTRTAYHGEGGTLTDYGTGSSGTTSSLPDTALYLGGVNGNGVGLKQVSAASIGAFLTSVEAQSFYDRLQAYMTAIGNV